MKIYVLSLGQLINSDQNQSVKEFALLKQKYSTLPNFLNYLWLNTLLINLALTVDQFYHKTIEQYRLGNIETEQFKDKILNQIGINQNTISAEEFEHAWNKMCEISLERITLISRLITSINNCDYVKILVPSLTNKLQYDSIQEQIGIDLNNDNIEMAISFQNNIIDNSGLTKLMIKKLNLDTEDHLVISLHRDINEENLSIKNADFEYVLSNEPVEWIIGNLTDNYNNF